MPALLCPSPVILDHSFPRSDLELRIVATALGELADAVKRDIGHLVLTSVFGEYLEIFDWDPPRDYALLSDIHRLLNQWFLQPSSGVIILRTSDVRDYEPHPVPAGCEGTGFVDSWSDEVGRLFVLHSRCASNGEFFIGIACPYAFAGQRSQTYCVRDERGAFPIIGPETIGRLSDGYEWIVPPNIHLTVVSFEQAKKNVFALGALSVDSPSGGSHYKVRFCGERPWTLDPNIDPIPERYLRELTEITGYPLNVIKASLTTGDEPRRALRLLKVVAVGST